MHPVVVIKSAALLRVANGPAGEAARHFGDILLRIPAIDAQCVQLHQLPRVVFIKPALGTIRSHAAPHHIRRNALPVVQIEQHRRTGGRRFQQFAEVTQQVRPDRLALISRDQKTVRAFVEIHVKVIEPEIVQLFFQLPRTGNGAIQFGFRQIVKHHRLRIVDQQQFPAQCGARLRHHLIPQSRRHRHHQIVDPILRKRRQQFFLLIGVAIAQRADLIPVEHFFEREGRLHRLRVGAVPFHLEPPSHSLHRGAHHRIGGQRLAALRHGTNHLRRRIGGHGLGRRHAQRFQRRKLRRQFRILRNSFRMKLQIDPFLEPDFIDRRDVARPGTERQPIQGMQRLPILGKLLLELRIIGGRFLRLLLGSACGQGRRAQQRHAHSQKLPHTSNRLYLIKRRNAPKVGGNFKLLKTN